jgi:sporulation integral membrane protein YtvI
MDPELQKSVKTLVKLAITVLALVSIYLLFIYVFPIIGKVLSYIPVLFAPFLLAIVNAVLIEPLVSFFEKRFHFKRSWSVLVSLGVSVGGFICLISLILSVIIKEMSSLYLLALSKSDQVINKVMISFTDFRIFYLNLALPPQLHETLQSNLQRGIELLQGLLDNSLNGLAKFIAILPGFFIFILISTIATFFIIRDRALIRVYILHFIPATARSGSRDVISHLLNALIGFFKAYSILISITAIITLVALKILGVKYVLTIGIIVGLMDILPILGPGAIFVPWIIWEFMADNAKMGISLLIVYIIISVVRQILEPQIVGDNIGLHPLATLISLYAGLKLGGVTGMILGPICIVVIIAFYRAGLLDRFIWRNRI